MHVMYSSVRSGWFHMGNSPIKVDNKRLFRLKNGTSHFSLFDLNNVSQCRALVYKILKFLEEIDLNKEMVSKLNYKSLAVLSAFTVGFIIVLLLSAKNCLCMYFLQVFGFKIKILFCFPLSILKIFKSERGQKGKEKIAKLL